MILIQWRLWAFGCLVILVFIIFSAFYVYRINAQRAPDDPKKKDYAPYAPWLAPFILPPLLLVNILFAILSSLAFGFFLVLFPLTLLLFRKPFLIKWILKQAQKVGNLILEIDTELLKTVGFHPATIKFQYEDETPA
jgi:uncharacterized protein YwbE